MDVAKSILGLKKSLSSLGNIGGAMGKMGGLIGKMGGSIGKMGGSIGKIAAPLMSLPMLIVGAIGAIAIGVGAWLNNRADKINKK
jgi:hypothetical protein